MMKKKKIWFWKKKSSGRLYKEDDEKALKLSYIMNIKEVIIDEKTFITNIIRKIEDKEKKDNKENKDQQRK